MAQNKETTLTSPEDAGVVSQRAKSRGNYIVIVMVEAPRLELGSKDQVS